MKPHGMNPTLECPLYSEFVADFDGLDFLELPSAHTVLFIAADAEAVSAETIARVAEKLLGSRLVYICVWGPDCERVHDIFDAVYVGDGSAEPTLVFMSTWHSDDALEEALWFFVENAVPLDVEMETISYVAVTVGRPEWGREMERWLADLPALKARVCGDDNAERGGR